MAERGPGESLALPSPGPDDQLRLLIDNVVDYAIIALDTEGCVTTWNPGAERIKGYTASEIIGRHFSIFYPPEDVAAGKPERALAVAAADGFCRDEGWRVRKDGSTFWADVTITALRGPRGELKGFGKVTRDLSERKQVEDALREVAEREGAAAKQLREADRAKQDLVAIVAHDLRAPIGVLHGTADMLVRDWNRLDEAERLRMLQMMASSSERLSSLVDDVLDVARIEAGQLHYDLTIVDAGSVVRRAADDVDPGQTRVTVTRPDEPRWVRVDERRLWQVLMNLLSNALKFSGSTEPVEVVVSDEDGTVRISVTDHGMGIGIEDQTKLFQRFSRIPRINAPVTTTGSGLGLYIARSLVQALGGDIGVESAPGDGATFWVTLPRVPAPS